MHKAANTRIENHLKQIQKMEAQGVWQVALPNIPTVSSLYNEDIPKMIRGEKLQKNNISSGK